MNYDNPASYSDYTPPDQLSSDIDDTGDLIPCDGCEEEFFAEDLTHHEDGNWYCEECNYETEHDREDARGDEAYHSAREDGEL